MIALEDLAKTKVAADMTPAQLETLCECVELREYSDGEMIVDSERRDFDLFVLVTGRGRVVGTYGQEVQEIESGNLIGELSFLDKRPRSASVASIGQSKVIVLTDKTMDELTATNPEIVARLHRNIGLILCDKLRRATRMIEALSISYV